MTELVSNCCSAYMGSISHDGPDWSDIEMCSECKEHCTVIDLSKQCEKCGEDGVIVDSKYCDLCD